MNKVDNSLRWEEANGGPRLGVKQVEKHCPLSRAEVNCFYDWSYIFAENT